MYFQIVEEVADKNREIHSDDIINTNGKMGAIPWASWSRESLKRAAASLPAGLCRGAHKK